IEICNGVQNLHLRSARHGRFHGVGRIELATAGRDDGVRPDAQDALLLIDNAHFEAAPGAGYIVIEKLGPMLVWKPDAGTITRAKNGDNRHPGGRCKVHGTTVVPKEKGRALDDPGADAWRHASAKVNGRAAPQ